MVEYGDMAYPLALNTDKFLTGGVMDAPDLTVRTAMNKLAWGMPISQKEAQRITQRQGLEQQSINVAQEAAQKQAMMGMSGVNVGSYAGSMWSAPGSYTAARPVAQQQGYNPEATADALLKARFGSFAPGQIRGTQPYVSQETPLIDVAGTQFPAVGSNQVAGVPMGMLQPATAPSAAAVQEVTQPQTSIIQSAPVLSQLIGGVAPQTPAASRVGAIPQATQNQLSPALAQILGRSMGQQADYGGQGPYGDQPQVPVGSALAAATPQMRSLAQSQQSFGLQKQQFEFQKKQAGIEEQRRKDELALKQSKQELGHESPIDAMRAAQGIPFDPESQMPSVSFHEGRYFPTIVNKTLPESTATQLQAKSTAAQLEGYDTRLESATRSLDYANQVERGMAGGAKFGPGQKVFTSTKRFLNTFGAGFDIADQELAEKGLAALGNEQLKAIAKGLGSMSDADRVFFERQIPEIGNSEKTIRFYVEMAKLNAKFAKEDAAMRDNLIAQGRKPAEVVAQLNAIRNSRNVAEEAYNKATGSAQMSESIKKYY